MYFLQFFSVLLIVLTKIHSYFCLVANVLQNHLWCHLQKEKAYISVGLNFIMLKRGLLEYLQESYASKNIYSRCWLVIAAAKSIYSNIVVVCGIEQIINSNKWD